ncbi:MULTISPECIES: chemotaxis protein CheW [unclassified Methylotenera]|jgi:twitching motility protein PilI|uniref:chemotaxis protein CheW n=1 Tax=unclassified Methylotenera TaxID=2643294 RepID=UPI00035D8F1C|nr:MULTISPECIES: chemotaxis protein CheW [unclassified Methylotenera]
MAAKNTLKNYQANILERLEEAKKAGSAAPAGYLGVVIAGKNVLVNMQEISETLPMMEIYPVPLVKSWFLGVANVRGVLYAINDIGQLMNGVATLISSSARVLLMSDEVTSHVAFLVEKLVGLRKLEGMQKVTDTLEHAFCMQHDVYEDQDGNQWMVLDCAKLVQSKEFIQSY